MGVKAARKSSSRKKRRGSSSGGKAKVFTWEDVRMHNGSSKGDGRMWTVIRGNVYDITDFVATHPGGVVIRIAAGRDGTELFDSYHSPAHQVRAEAYLGSTSKKAKSMGLHYLGVIDKPLPEEDETFFRTVQKRVFDSLEERGLTGPMITVLGLLEFFLTIGAYGVLGYYWIYAPSVWVAFLTGLVTARMGFLMHSGNHCSVGHHWFINRLVGLGFDMVGGSSLVWMMEHQVAHHLHPNTFGHDNDCEIGNPFIRFHPSIERRWYHRFQAYYTLLAVPFGFFRWLISEIPTVLAGIVGHVKFSATWSETFVVIVSKAVWFLTKIYLPLRVSQYNYLALAGYLMIHACTTMWYLSNIFVVNHIHGELMSPDKGHWAIENLRTTANWSSGSHFWAWFSGGLNHQVEHHLFPTVSTYLYPVISPIIKECCEEFDLPYNSFSHFPEAWGHYMKYLYLMGKYDEMPRDAMSPKIALCHA